MDPVTDPSPALKALRYAEEELGVHSVLQTAQDAHTESDMCIQQIVELRAKKRVLEEARLTRELDLQTEEAGMNPGMSVASFKEHMKGVLHRDAELTALRDSLREVANNLDSWEFERESHQAAMKIAVARLGELGGYLNYLAAIKNQALQQSNESRDERNPWT